MAEEENEYEFRIPCSWSVCGTMTVRAKNLEEALEVAYNGDLPYDSDYMDGSFEVDDEGARYLNEKILKKIKEDKERKKNPINFIVQDSFKPTKGKSNEIPF